MGIDTGKGCSSSKCAAVMYCQGSFQSRCTDGQGRKENYLIGMLNKGGLAFPVSTWIPCAVRRHLVLPKTPERILNWCILESMFNSHRGSEGNGKGIMPPEFEHRDFPSFNVNGYDLEFSDEEHQVREQEAQQTHHHQSQESMSNPAASKSKTRAVPYPTSDIFIKHFEKVTLHSDDMQAKCKYYSKSPKFQQGGGFGILTWHIEKNHPVEIVLDRLDVSEGGCHLPVHYGLHCGC